MREENDATADFILRTHRDGVASFDAAWDAYFTRLRAAGAFHGGSSIGGGVCLGATVEIRELPRVSAAPQS